MLQNKETIEISIHEFYKTIASRDEDKQKLRLFEIFDSIFIEIQTILSIVARVEEVTKATIDMQHMSLKYLHLMIDTIDSFMYRLLAFCTFVLKFIYLHYLSSLTHLLAALQLQGIRKHLSQTMFLFLFCFLLLTLNICSKLVSLYMRVCECSRFVVMVFSGIFS